MKDNEYTYFSAFLQISKAISSSIEFETVLHLIVKSLCDITDSKGCTLMLLDEQGQRLELKAFYGLSEQYLKKGPVAADKSIADALKGEPVIIEDATSDPRVQYPEEARREGIASIVSVPIILRGKSTGVLRLYTSVACQFTEDDVQFLSAVALQSGLAIENAKIHQELKSSYQRGAASYLTS